MTSIITLRKRWQKELKSLKIEFEHYLVARIWNWIHVVRLIYLLAILNNFSIYVISSLYYIISM